MSAGGPIEVPKIEAWDDQSRAQVQKTLEQMAALFNGGLDPSSHFNARVQKVTFDVAGVEKTVMHGLGRIPKEFHVILADAGATVYQSKTKQATSDRIFLAATAPVTVTIRFL
jgi:hypothetical protein